MKKLVLFSFGLFLFTINAKADIGFPTDGNMGYVSIHKVVPIEFVENGIKFSIFLNGDFDFVANSRAYNSTVISYRKGIKYVDVRTRSYKGILRNRFGQIIRIDGIPISYDRFGNVTRIGSVDIDYRGTRMTQVGNLHILYNPHGYVKYIGFVKPRMSSWVYSYNHFYNGMTLDYDDDNFYDDHFYTDFGKYREDNDYYYYKSKKGKSEVVVKRKKETVTNRGEDRKRRS